MDIDNYLDGLVVNSTIMPGDHMYRAANPSHYFSVGRSALRQILMALQSVGKTDIREILDFACGSGRVTRWLCSAFPDARVHAAELREESLQFLADTFGSEVWKTSADFALLKPRTTFDLVWCGSLITHLNDHDARAAIAAMRSWLNPGGVLVVSFHGRKVLSNYRSGHPEYLPPELFSKVLEGNRMHGHGYVDYPGRKGIGFSLSSYAWMFDAMIPSDDNSYRVVGFCEAAWDNHHDIIAVERMTSSWLA